MAVGLNALGSVQAHRLQHRSDVSAYVAGCLGVVAHLTRHAPVLCGPAALWSAFRRRNLVVQTGESWLEGWRKAAEPSGGPGDFEAVSARTPQPICSASMTMIPSGPRT
jgi:hypothetical protein